jgi:non-canonical (house-cleaning) NTP pyrophosphatase
MKRMRVVVASERRPKVEAVRRALARLAQVDGARWGECEVVALAATSGVRATPLSDAEIQRGARTRARAAERELVARGEGASLYLGLEGGLHVESDGEEKRVWLRSWTYATDGAVEGFGCGPSVELPARIARAALRGVDPWGYVTHELIGRADAFEASVVAALARFYNREAYEDVRPIPE